ncbi:B12-binding domain-containing radical SAM protein [Carboxylicivirga marina]|uniref:B12-binding domain-containing radical SAM protein n=1 Tax=Carboxylicivirga marina TaxID=2800988 RepID=UPI002596101A|nr:radical SAM protein [uncultured Carboxylicivirga sp.]
MPKILFIQPSQYSVSDQKPIKQNRIYLPGLSFPLLAAITPDNWTVQIKIEIIEEVDFDTDADLVGIGAMGVAIFRAIDLAKKFKEKGKTVIMGGYMPSITPWFVQDHCDSIIIGDAEISYLKLLKDFESTGKVQKTYNNPIKDLKNLPIPEYKLLLDKKIGFMLPVQAGRGCPKLCSFCSIACLYKGKYLTRPVDEVLRDIRQIKNLGFKYFYLIDDNIAGNQIYLEELCKKIKPLKMKWGSQCSIELANNPDLLKLVAKSGCRILSLGIESLSQEGLNDMKKKWVKSEQHEVILKKITKAGILPATEMIVGIKGDTPDSIRETFKLIMRTKVPIPKFYIMTPFPGTKLFEEYKQKGKLVHEDYSKYTTAFCIHYPEKFSPEELETIYWWMYKKVYTPFNILRRTILRREFLKNPLIYLYALAVNFHYRKFIKKGDAPNIC